MHNNPIVSSLRICMFLLLSRIVRIVNLRNYLLQLFQLWYVRIVLCSDRLWLRLRYKRGWLWQKFTARELVHPGREQDICYPFIFSHRGTREQSTDESISGFRNGKRKADEIIEGNQSEERDDTRDDAVGYGRGNFMVPRTKRKIEGLMINTMSERDREREREICLEVNRITVINLTTWPSGPLN